MEILKNFSKKLDVLFVTPSNQREIYQELSINYTTIEPPTWSLLLSKSCKSKGFSTAILDTNAEKLTDEQSVERIKSLNPKLICFVIYGENVSAGITNVSGAVRLTNFIKKNDIDIPISYLGTYAQSVPIKLLNDEKSVDFCFTNEGVKALWNILSLDKIDINDLDNIKGIAWRKNGKPIINATSELVTDLDSELPGYDWESLPYKNKPFDLYRAPLWHSLYNEDLRSPYAAIQTSLGCRFGCKFCVINMINRNDNQEIGFGGNYSKMRYWSPEFIVKEFDKLAEYGVHTVKCTDELFMFDKNYYIPLCNLLKERDYSNKSLFWCYSRCDTVSQNETLELVRKAGFRWAAIGFEAGNRNVRLEVTKGRFKDVDIKDVVNRLHNSGIEVTGNYIFGLPSDTSETMQQTLDLSLELCTSGWNGYGAMNLIGSELYYDAVKQSKQLPQDYLGYSFLSYETVCNSTDTLSAAEILKFRDDAFMQYHTYQPFLDRINRLYGQKAVENIKEMCKIKLRRKIIKEAGLYKD